MPKPVDSTLFELLARRTLDYAIFLLNKEGKPDDETRSWEAGFDLHLVKPVDENKILSLIGSSKTVH